MNKKKKRSRGTALYWICLGIYTVALIVFAVILLRDWKKYLVAYDAAQPAVAMDNYIAGLDGPEWEAKLTQAVTSVSHPFQSDEECMEILKQRSGSGLTYARAPSGGLSGVKYNIACNDYLVGSVILEQDMSKLDDIDIGLISKALSKDTLCPWIVQSESFDDVTAFLYMNSFTTTVPSTYTVKLNGIPVGEEFITERDIKYDLLEPYYSTYEGLPTKVTYSVDNKLLGDVQSAIYDENGNEVTIDPAKGDIQFMAPCSDEEIAELSAFALNFVEPYARYFGTSNVNGNAGPLKDLIVPGCSIEKRMTEFIDGAQWIHFGSLSILSKDFNGAFRLCDRFYVVNVNVSASAYGEYKTVTMDTPYTIVVCRTDNGLKAVSVE